MYRKRGSAPVSDNLLLQALGQLDEVAGLHGVVGAALGLAAQVGGVAEHGAQRHIGRHDDGAVADIRSDHLTAAGVEVADYGAHIVLGRGHADLHDGLEQRRAGLGHGLFESHAAADAEGVLAGVDLVEGAVYQRGLHVDDLIAAEYAGLHGALDALVHAGDIFLRYRAAVDVVNELVALAGLVGLDGELDVRELAAAAGLAHEARVDGGGLGDGLLVRYLGLADVGLDLELAQQPVDYYLQVQLAHTGDDRLTGLLVGVGLEGRVLFGQLCESDAHLLLAGLGLGLDGHADDGLGELHVLEHDLVLVIAERIARGGVLQADGRGDVAGVGGLQVLTVIGVHQKDAAHALALALRGVDDGVARVDRAGIDAEEGELADIGVGHDLERERRERSIVARRALLGLAGLGVDALDRRDVERAGQIVDDGVEQLLHALVLVRGAADDGHHLDRDGGAADGGADLVRRHFLALKVHLHDLVVEVADRLQHLVAVLLRLLEHVRGYLLNAHVLAQIVIVDIGLHFDQVDYAAEVRLLAYRELDRDRVGFQTVVDHVDHVVEVRTHDVHLVDIDDARYVIVVGLAPDRFGLGLNAALGTEHGDAAVEHAETALHLNGEVDVSRGVDDVETAAAPVAGRRGARDRDAALLLLLHPVHRSGALVRLAYLVVDARIEQNALRGRGLARVNVGHYADISGILKRIISGHRTLLNFLLNFLPPEMCEGLVGLRHLVSILTLLDCGAEAVAGVHYLAGKALLHRLLAALAGIQSQPAQAEGLTALGTDLDRHLIGGAADAAGLDLQAGHDVVHGLSESLEGILPALVLDYIKRIVHDLLCDALLTVQHDAVDELGHQHAVVYRIRQNFSFGNVTSSGHYASLLH